MSKTKVVLLSGGLDSTCALFDTVGWQDPGVNVEAVFIAYEQKNLQAERASAIQAAKALRVKLEVISAHVFQNSKSSILEGNEQELMNVTTAEIRHRNAMLIMLAAANTKIEGEVEFIVAAHRTNAPYADATSQFYTKMDALLKYSSNNRHSCSAPYIRKTKLQLAKLGYDAGMTKADFENSTSCYLKKKPEDKACGKCPACVARREVMKAIFG